MEIVSEHILFFSIDNRCICTIQDKFGFAGSDGIAYLLKLRVELHFLQPGATHDGNESLEFSM